MAPSMNKKTVLTGKRLLIVDDEKDILDTLVNLLDDCKLDTASSFEEAKKLLSTENYDLVVLDIMGVQGYDLLDMAKKRCIPALMLTAHALSESDLIQSAQRGASFYAPKDKIMDIALFVSDVLEATENMKNPWLRWYERLGSYYDRAFRGQNWRQREKAFWKKKLEGLW